MTCAFLLRAEKYMNYLNKTVLNLGKQQYLPHYWSDKGCKNTVVNQALPSLNRAWLKMFRLLESYKFFVYVDILFYSILFYL